ncbi:MAG: hypothetical protein ACRES3_04335, partial [Steroidobacteraceae bacterium]
MYEIEIVEMLVSREAVARDGADLPELRCGRRPVPVDAAAPAECAEALGNDEVACGVENSIGTPKM